jgi:hypothetical protein
MPEGLIFICDSAPRWIVEVSDGDRTGLRPTGVDRPATADRRQAGDIEAAPAAPPALRQQAGWVLPARV